MSEAAQRELSVLVCVANSSVDPRRNPQPAIDGHSPGEDLTERTMLE